MSEWPFQVANDNFGALVSAALAGEPQMISLRGSPAVIVLSAEQYDRLCRGARPEPPTLSEPLREIPQDDREFDRLPLPQRPLNL